VFTDIIPVNNVTLGVLKMNVKETVRTHSRPTGEEGKEIGLKMNEHHFKLWGWGLNHVSVEPDSSILDVGCGGGRAVSILAELAEKGKIYGIDHSQDMVDLATEYNSKEVELGRVTIMESSVSELPFPYDKFDLVTAFETCYFWPDLEEGLREIKRVLKKGGTLLIVNEMYDHELFTERNSPYNTAKGMNIYSAEEYRKALTSAGFLAIEIDEVPEDNWITVVAKK